MLLLVAACAEEPVARQAPASIPSTAPSAGEHIALTPVDFSALPGWQDDTLGEATIALAKSCSKIADLPPSQPIGREGVGGSAGDWLGPCGALRDLNIKDSVAVRQYFETWFRPLRATATGSNGLASGLFTGYYESELNGSLVRDAKHRVPLYARPADLVALDLGPFDATLQGKRIWGRFDANNRLVPYWTRQEIENGALGGNAKVILWIDDPVDAHILSIQGSGRVTLADGGTIRVGFDGTNGRTFVGITRILMDAGKINAHQATMPDTRAWLEAHPADAVALMDKNPRYIFFRLIEGDGPIGAQGVALTPLRSLAVDPSFIPLGMPIWLDTTTPDGKPLRRLMVAQDTGAAIKGAIRADIFWGTGPRAFDQAGRMKSTGAFYLLVPRQRSGQVALAGNPAN
jgi:membrane-bound lytic murein transglycosylase A